MQTAAAEVCVVSEDGSVALEGFVFPDLGRQQDAQWFGGVRPEQFRTGCSPRAMQDLVEHELTGCVLVGYGLSKDLSSLHVGHPLAMQRELMACRKFQAGRGAKAQKLQVLALKYLGSHIQSAHHSAREDAHAVLQLYLQYVKDDPAQMSYQDLVQLETKQLMQHVADMRHPL